MHLQLVGDIAGINSRARCTNRAAELVCKVIQHAEPLLALQAPPTYMGNHSSQPREPAVAGVLHGTFKTLCTSK